MTRVFGVEIELNCALQYARYGDNRQRRIQPMVDNYSMTYEERDILRSGGPHPRGEFVLPPGWKYVPDGSCGSELVSPPIANIWSVREVCRRVHASGIEYTLKDCGLHVHCQAVDFDESDVMAVAKFCRHFDRTLFSFMAPQRIKSEYCRPMARDDDAILKEIRGESVGYVGRYRGCNLQSFFKHGTIEFRYAEGSDDPDRIESLVELYTSIMDYCKSHKGKVNSPKNREEKRIFLLDLLGISTRNKELLLNHNG